MAEPQKNELRQLTLIETFHLYVWTMWRAGAISEQAAAQILLFSSKLSPKETVDFCFGELDKLRAKYAGIDDLIKESSVGQSVEGSGEAGSIPVGGSEASPS